jgi:hypothetical protein
MTTSTFLSFLDFHHRTFSLPRLSVPDCLLAASQFLCRFRHRSQFIQLAKDLLISQYTFLEHGRSSMFVLKKMPPLRALLISWTFLGLIHAGGGKLI